MIDLTWPIVEALLYTARKHAYWAAALDFTTGDYEARVIAADAAATAYATTPPPNRAPL